MKNVIQLATIGLMVMAIAGSQLNLNAQEAASSAATGKGAKAERSYPFNGTLKEVNKADGTVKVSNRTFTLSTETQYLQGSLDDAKIGEKVGGSYWKREDGTLEVRSIRFGPKPKKEKKGKDGE